MPDPQVQANQVCGVPFVPRGTVGGVRLQIRIGEQMSGVSKRAGYGTWVKAPEKWAKVIIRTLKGSTSLTEVAKKLSVQMKVDIKPLEISDFFIRNLRDLGYGTPKSYLASAYGRVSLGKYKKAELVWMSNHYCRAHRHTYLEHPHCYELENPQQERWGYLDIETSHLKANLGLVLCYCIKVRGEKTIYEAKANKKDLQDPKSLDKKVIEKCCTDLRRFDRILTYYGCVTPGHKVLTSDLRWVPVESLKKGDGLLAFDEEIQTGNRTRNFTRNGGPTNGCPVARSLAGSH